MLQFFCWKNPNPASIEFSGISSIMALRSAELKSLEIDKSKSKRKNRQLFFISNENRVNIRKRREKHASYLTMLISAN